MADEKTRYNDSELEEFRQLIEKKLASARADYEMLRSATNNENDTEDSSPTFKVMEEGATTLSKEEYGVLWKYASFCIPPESVRILWAVDSRTIISINDTGSIMMIFLLFCKMC